MALRQIIGSFVGGASAAAALTAAGTLYSERNNLIVNNQNIAFPEDLKSAYIHMRFSKYERRSINQQPFFSPQNSIRLPIPKELNDTVNVQYSQTELGPLIGASVDSIAAQLQGGQNRSFDSIVNQVGGIAAGAATQSLLGAAAGTTIGSAVTTLVSAASSLSGLAINPFQTVLFKSPNFKKHRFSWRLVPKNEQESKNIEFILRLFKYHMLPGISVAGSVFFSYPEILEVKLFPKDEYLYRFKPCVVESVNVNYAPNGPSFYRASSAPTAVEFSISLQEIEIWTKADYVRDINGRPSLNTAPNLRAGL